MNKIDEGKRILNYYFELIAANAGLYWCSNNVAEINHAVDMIVEGIQEALEEENASTD